MNEKSLKLLEQYDLELISARRGRGSYICETSLGKKLLTDYTGSEKKIVFTNQLMDPLRQILNTHIAVEIGIFCIEIG